MKNLLSLSALLLFFAQTIAQTTYTWDGSSSSAWATAANWTPSGTPTATDHVIIVNASNDPVLSANVTVANFTITGGGLDLNGDTITVIKDLKVKGSSLVVKVGTKVKGIRLCDGDHDIDCKIDGIGAMKLKSEFVRKV